MDIKNQIIEEWETELFHQLKNYFSIENKEYWNSRYIKIRHFKKRPLELLSPMYFSKKNPYLFTMDQFSHYYSLWEFPDISFLKKIIFLPKWIQTNKYFLTNLYITSEKTLIFYLCPIRIFLEPITSHSIQKEQTFSFLLQNDRVIYSNPYKTKLQNLFYILNIIESLQKKSPIFLQDSFGIKQHSSYSSLFKFIETTRKLTPEEQIQMQEIHDFFLLKHPIHKI